MACVTNLSAIAPPGSSIRRAASWNAPYVQCRSLLNQRQQVRAQVQVRAKGKKNPFDMLLEETRRKSRESGEAGGAKDSCPCGSGQEYEACCGVYHQGGKEPNALVTMKARYSAYARGVSDYILKTTHKDNPKLQEDGEEAYAESVRRSCEELTYRRLKILGFKESEEEAFVSFRVTYREKKARKPADQFLYEKSRFVPDEDKRWLYIEGQPLSGAS